MADLNPLFPLPGSVTKTAWELPENLSEREWQAIGGLLAELSQAVQWWMGDWWAYGERYGRRAFIQSADWIGPPEAHCDQAGAVSRAFVPWVRRPGLPFLFYCRVSDLPIGEAHELLKWCEQQRDQQGRLPTLRELILHEKSRHERPASSPSVNQTGS